jgi:hypothetical protein
MWIAPVQSPAAYASLDSWSADLAGFDFSVVRKVAADATFTIWFGEEELLAPGQAAGALDLTGPLDHDFSGEATFLAPRDGVLHGLGGWFVADLSPGVRLTNAPPIRGSWMHAFLPVRSPVEVAAGEEIRARVEVRTEDELWRWWVEAAGVEQSGSTLAAHVQPLRG